MLLERPGEVVSREELRRKLWPGDIFVNFEASLNSAVHGLRKTLLDTSLEPRYVETLPRVGYRFIASVETRPPVSEAASQSAVRLNSAVFPPADTVTEVSPSTSSVKARDWPRWAVLRLALVLLVAYFGYRYRLQHRQLSAAQAQPSPAVPSSLPRRSIAVMGFANVSGIARDAWLSTAFTEMLATELAAGDRLRMVPEEDVSRAKLELSLTNRDTYGGTTLTKIRNDIGCDYVVAGSYLAIGPAGSGQLRLDARVEDTVTGDTVASFAVAGSRSDLFDLASRAGEQLRARLGIGTLTSTETEEAKLALPSDPEAARLYSDGLAKLRVYDDAPAVDLLQKAIRLQPEYSPAYSALATAWSDLGYDTDAASAARKAMDLAHNLPQQLRLQIEGRYHEINADWTHATDLYSRLWQSYPDDLDYGLSLARAQEAMGKNADATATLVALRKLPSPERDDPRIDLAEARIARDLADYKREQTLADSAASKAAMTGANLLLARAKLTGGYASNVLGNLSVAMDAYAAAQRTFAESGDSDSSALALMEIGGLLAKQGNIPAAERNIEQALNVFREHGDRAHESTSLSNLGEMLEIDGDLPKAEIRIREAVAISTKLNRVNYISTYNLAELLERQGKFREAKDMLEQLVEHVQNGGNKSVLGAALQTLGLIAETQGDMPTALSRYREAIARFKETGAKSEYTDAERSLGEALMRAGDTKSARQAFSEALSVDSKVGAKTDASLDQIGLADVALADGNGSVDVSVLRSAVDELRLRRMTNDEIEAEIVLSRELAQQGNNALAAKVLGQTAVLSARSYDPTIRFDVALATAELRGMQHRFEDARRSIQPELRTVDAVGCVRCQLEARLELGEIEMQTGNTEQGRNQLHQLADEAQRRGFGLIAEHATADAK